MKHLMLINYFVLIAILIVVADENRKTITVGKAFTFQIPQDLRLMEKILYTFPRILS